jgi:hypothetical protein
LFFVVIEVLIDNFFSDVSTAESGVSDFSQMSAVVSFFECWEFFEKFFGAASFEFAGNFAD